MSRPVLAFIGVCTVCRTPMEPCPAEGPGATWKTAEQWTYLALKRHEETCPGRPEDQDVSALAEFAAEITAGLPAAT